ncbi:hypothetical protein NE612_01300 [Oscillibacter valericigenes]|nr:hypothetical protein [Oscillibacter valericigenes]
MKEYIERAAVLSAVRRAFDDEECDCEVMPVVFKALQEVEAADVVDVRHGRWIFDHMTGEWSYYSHCSECNHQEFFANEDAEKRHKYCLNCGARMGKEADHETVQ